MKRVTGLLAALALLFPVVATAIEFDELGGVEIHGFVSQGYLYSDDNNFFANTSEGSAEFAEYAVNVSSDVSDQVHVGIQIFARDLGEFGDNEPEIDWAYADYRWRDALGIRLGKMKLGQGLYNATRDIDFLRTSIFLPQSTYNEAWRDTAAALNGGEIYGDVYLGGGGSLAYQIQGGNMSFPVDGGVVSTTSDQSRLAGLEFEADDTHSDYGGAASIMWSTPIEGLKLGTSGWFTRFEIDGDASVIGVAEAAYNSAIDQRLGGAATNITTKDITQVKVETEATSYTASILYEIDSWTFAAEYSGYRYEFSNRGLGTDSLSQLINIADNRNKILDADGFYGSVAYRFNDVFELGFYYSEYYADKDDRDGDRNELTGLQAANKFNFRNAVGYNDYDSWLKDACLTGRFDISDNWIVKIEAHRFNGAAILMKEINSNDSGVLDTEEDWYLFAAKATFSF